MSWKPKYKHKTCISCELRFPNADGRYCKPCRAAEKALSRHWYTTEYGPLLWDGRSHRSRIGLTIGLVCKVCKVFKKDVFALGLCQACYGKKKRGTLNAD